MNPLVCKQVFTAPPVNYAEILRYAGYPRRADTAPIDTLLSQLEGKLLYQVCYRQFSVCEADGVLDLGFVKTPSEDLKRALRGHTHMVLFAATIGLEIDRMIYRCGKLAPADALLLQAIGAERIESLCNLFCAYIGAAGTRFSPGYGDLPLQLQRDVFSALDCPQQIGLTLNDSLLMTPSKSVTAIVAIG